MPHRSPLAIEARHLATLVHAIRAFKYERNETMSPELVVSLAWAEERATTLAALVAELEAPIMRPSHGGHWRRDEAERALILTNHDGSVFKVLDLNPEDDVP